MAIRPSPSHPRLRRLLAVLASVVAAASLTATAPARAAETNLAAGKAFTASSSTEVYQPGRAGDGDADTYWESANNAFPQWIQVDLGSAVALDKVVLRLPPAPAWATRTQTVSFRGSTDGSTFAELKPGAGYVFNPASGNTVTVDLPATTTRYLRLTFTANTGWPAGQLAELEVYGPTTPPPTGTDLAAGKPIEASSTMYSFAATNANDGNVATYWEGSAYPANLTVKLGSDAVTKAVVVKLNPDPIWAARTQTFSILGRAHDASAFTTLVRSATYRFDPASGNTVTVAVSATVADVRLGFTANTGAPSGQVAEFQVIGTPVPEPETSDLVGAASWSPGNPAAGDPVTFSVTLRNAGNIASASGAHAVTVTILNGSTTVRTLTGSYTGTLAPGASAPPIALGSWTAATGRYTVRTVIADDPGELPDRRANNTTETPLLVGRGANMPYDSYEAEDGQLGGGAQVVGPNRTIGDLAGEASGRRAVTLNQIGASVQWTTKAKTNTLVARFSIPDGTNSSINVYVDGTLNRTLPLTSKYAWLYGEEANPQNSGTGARHIYDEANIMLTGTVAAGSTIRLQKDGANPGPIAIDFINTEQVTPIANPDPAKYVVPSGFDQQAVQAALDAARMDTGKTGVYLPAGDYRTTGKFQVFGRAIQVVGAGPWYTRFSTPTDQTETDAGFSAQSGAGGSAFKNFAFFGNYTIRRDGPGKVFDFSNIADITIDNIWAEHVVCLYWGANTDRMTLSNSRIRNTFADGLNMTNGSTDNHVVNIEARATGDDSFALFSAIDAGGADETGNVYENLTSILTWRAAGVAVYGGYNNKFRNIYIADTLVYSGITISSLDFGIPMNGFGADPPTVFDNVTIVRAGGHFWGAQTFPAIWVFSASKVFQGIRVSNVDIIDPTYSGIMFQTNYVGGQPQFPIKDTTFTNVTITGAQRSGDAFDAKSGFGIWANPMPEAGQGPAVGEVSFTNLRLANNHRDIENPTTTFTIRRN
ncbi:CARDB protein [Krasilnikovia cinnamomea]|uniref:CARDB protein n=1 Tax=Krasilnikovia cinnamomea TaxID=349313 RepID=A0A4Q7ZEY6_9ACTN|nr:discoidin domain-containing protein [Krasilnikovia cinnamomea]RZU49248.1 CARDB protein [Krasilnikovia cinnamomea]